MFRRLFAKIPAQLPKAFVIGIFFWVIAGLFIAAAFVCALLGWHAAYKVAFAATFVCILGFGGSIAWLLVDRRSGRTTRWRD